MSGLTPLKVISGWRRYARIVAEAASRAVPGAEVYLAGERLRAGSQSSAISTY